MSTPEVTRILVPLDGSEPSWRAFERAVQVATLTGATIDAVCVFDVREVDADIGLYQSTEQIDGLKKHLSDDVLEAAKAKAPKPGPKVETRLLVGVVNQRLLEELEKQEHDLVVAGRTGKGFFTRMLEGSTSRFLTAHAPCPVMIVP